MSTPVSEVMRRGNQIRRRRRNLIVGGIGVIMGGSIALGISAGSQSHDTFTPSCAALSTDRDVNLFNECRAMEQTDTWSRTKTFDHGKHGSCWQLTNDSTSIFECKDGTIAAVK